MDNCIKSFALDCFQGRYAAFRVLGPLRATLLVDIRERRVVDLRVARGKNAPLALHTTIDAWLRSATKRAT